MYDIDTLVAESRPADEAFADMAARDPEMAEIIAEYNARTKVEAFAEILDDNAALIDEWVTRDGLPVVNAKNTARHFRYDDADHGSLLRVSIPHYIEVMSRFADRLSGTRVSGPAHARVTRVVVRDRETAAERAGHELAGVVANLVLAMNGHATV